jgi:hypothetical protein
MSVVPFVRPLQWILDLDLRGDEIRTIAEVMAWSAKPKRHPTYRLVALRCRIVAACVTSPEVRQQLLKLAVRCDQVSDRAISLVGMKLVATGDVAALRKVTKDTRVVERSGL